MPKLVDENKVTWDIRTTSVQVANSPATASWFAAVDDTTQADYSGNEFPLKDEDTFDGKGGTTVKITWPGNGNPILRGDGNINDAITAVKAFAARQKAAGSKTVALRVTASPESGSGVLLVLIAIVVLIMSSDKKHR